MIEQDNYELAEPAVEVQPKQKYKSSKGDADKRKKQSLINLAKARQAKLAQLKEKRETQEYDVYDTETESSSSSEEEIVLAKKSSLKPKKMIFPGKPKKQPIEDDDRLARLERAVMTLASHKEKKPKRKVIEKRTVIQIPPAAAPSYNPAKQQLLNLC